MHILSKYKDFYDYLTGIYGEDPLLVLDRREHSQPDWTFPSTNQWMKPKITKHNLWIGDHNIEFMRYGYDFYYGEDIFNIPTIRQVDHPMRSAYSEYNGVDIKHLLAYQSIDVPENRRWGCDYILKQPLVRERPKFLPQGVVIAVGDFGQEHLSKYGCFYPILQDMKLNKYIPPEQIYKIISDYLSLQRTKAENRVDNRTNIEKIQTNGFDKQTSFRGK